MSSSVLSGSVGADDSEDEYAAVLDSGGAADPGAEASRPEWKVITRETLLAAQTAALAQVTTVLSVGTHAARTLLIHHRWSVEALFAAYAEHGLDDALRLAGVLSRAADDAEQAASAAAASGLVSCGACLNDVALAEATRMPCGHAFCNGCWLDYFRIKIGDGQSRRVTCMAVKCGAICDDTLVARLVASEPEVVARYERSLLESYIEDNAKVKWCPSVPHCGSAVEIFGEPQVEPQCNCGLRFCFACGDAPHSPCTCTMMRLWKAKCSDASETANWMVANTKPCPKCTKPVEKAGGCNLVGCTCGQCFCWLCGQATGREHTWSTIAGHSCGRYREDAEAAAERATRDLQRYLHFHSRYKAHADSRALEEAHRAEVAAKIDAAVETGGAPLRDYTWLTAGQAQLFVARRCLSSCYIFAFYMFGGEMFAEDMTAEERSLKQDLFDDHREELEHCVEALSQRIEAPLEQMTDASRLEVVNLTALVDARCANMFEIVEHDLLGALTISSAQVAPYRSGAASAARSAASSRARAETAYAALEAAAAAAQVERAAAEADARRVADAAQQQLPPAGAAGAQADGLQNPKRQRRGRPGPGEAVDEAVAELAAGAAAVAFDPPRHVGHRRGNNEFYAQGAADRVHPDDLMHGAAAVCPVCALSFELGADNDTINAHVDSCLAVAAGTGRS